ncbi:MAG: pilus assembly protein [Actinobacteria bacterium]|nr:pilus assembly protein [Actinomycetota bacterium]
MKNEKYAFNPVKILKYSRGQSTLEFAVLLPFLFMVIFFVCQIGYFVYIQNIVEHAAYEGARIISTTNSSDKAVKIIHRILKTKSTENININVKPESGEMRKTGSVVQVEIEYIYKGIAGVLELLNGQGSRIKSNCCMRMECE